MWMGDRQRLLEEKGESFERVFYLSFYEKKIAR